MSIGFVRYVDSAYSYVHIVDATSNTPHHSHSPIPLLFLQSLFAPFAANVCFAPNVLTRHENVFRV